MSESCRAGSGAGSLRQVAATETMRAGAGGVSGHLGRGPAKRFRADVRAGYRR